MYDSMTASVTPRSSVTVRQDDEVTLVRLDGALAIHVTSIDGDAGGYAAAAMMRDAWAQVAEGYAARIRAAAHDEGCRDHGHEGECFPAEAVPTCDICGQPDGPGEPDWNGETGNHRSCEDREHAEGTGRESVREDEREMVAGRLLDLYCGGASRKRGYTGDLFDAIPPAYTEFVGRQLVAALAAEGA